MATAKKASTKKAAKGSSKVTTVTGGSTLTVRTSRQARLPKIAIELGKAFKRAGCPACRSGIDRIVFQDQVLGSVK